MSLPKWLIYTIEAPPEKDYSGLTVLYKEFDNLYKRNEFYLVDEILRELDVSVMSPAQMLTVLTSTRLAENKLLFRTDFYNRVENELKKRGETHPSLLRGLEPRIFT